MRGMDDDQVRNFGWVVEDRLAGCALPRNQSHLNDLYQKGIRAIVSTTENELPFNEKRFEWLHVPIVDFSIPERDQIPPFLDFVNRCVAQDKPVVVHCYAGLGRTGMLLAAALVHWGTEANTAMAEVRSRRPHSIVTREQEIFVESMDQWIERRE